MNKFWQVAVTYLMRPRFWVFGAIYVPMAWSLNARSDFDRRVVASSTVACMACVFVALHLRRQFGSPAAKMVPGFALPHLVVGALASLLIWAFVPAVQAWLAGIRPWGTIAIHSLAGMFLALAICWRKGIALLAALPIVEILLFTKRDWQHPRVTEFVLGNEPGLALVVIALTVLASGIAAVFLLRLSDLHVAVSDDLLAEPARTDRLMGRWDEGLLAFRDAVVERRLQGSRDAWWAVERWRIPVATSWAQLGLGTGLIATLMFVAWISSYREFAVAIVAMVMSTWLLLFAPFGQWHWRRNWLGSELMRPVTRAAYFRELSLALAVDIGLWTGLAVAIAVVSEVFEIEMLSRPWRSRVSDYQFMAGHVALLLSSAIVLYGLALATLRLRYWLPLTIGIAIPWLLGLAVLSMSILVARSLADPRFTLLLFAGLLALNAGAGLLLAWVAYRRFLHADLT